MAVLSSGKVSVGLGLGIVAVGAVAFTLRRQSRKNQEKGSSVSEQTPEDDIFLAEPSVAEAGGAHSVKSRIGNFKVSKIKRIVESIAEEFGTDHLYDAREQRVYHFNASTDSTVVSHENESERATREKQTFEEAVRVVKLVRQSGVHKKLPHFHTVDRQLDNAQNFLDEISDNVEDFWRYNRDEPMADIMTLPFMQLAASGGADALVPVTQSYANFIKSQSTDEANLTPADMLVQDLAILGADADATWEQVDSAFRKRSHKLHKHGHCIDLEAFHELNNAYQRWLARRSGIPSNAASKSTDVLAHYLLCGSDPFDSRYRECAVGILDASHREKLLQKIDVLRNWGETSGSTTGLGNG